MFAIARWHIVGVGRLFLVDRYHWIKEEGDHSWEEFERDLCSRFGEEVLEDVAEEIMRMRQEGTMEECQDKFEDIRIRLERLMPNPGESYFLSSFIGGLRDDVRPMVRMMQPSTLAQAFKVAKFQKQILNCGKKPTSYFKPYQTTLSSATNTYNFGPYKNLQPPPSFPYFTKPPNIDTKASVTASKPLQQPSQNSQSSVAFPASKPNSSITNTTTNSNTISQPRPCFKCGDKYFPGHQCKQQKTVMSQ